MIKHQQKHWKMVDVTVRAADPRNGHLQQGDLQIGRKE